MARLLALDWDGKEARYVVANTRGARLEVEAAGAVPMPSEGEGAAVRRQLGGALRAALAGKANRATTLLALGRSQVELVSLTLPPASDAELPEMVRNQATRENTAIADDATIDFFPVNDNAAEPRKVTAMALPQARLEQVQLVLTEAGLTARSIGMRPYATGALVQRALADGKQPALVINLLAEEADLIVLSEGRVVYWRTLRQSGASHDAAAASRLLAEVQRTLVVAASSLSGRAVEAIYLCGGLDEHPALLAAAREQLSSEVTLIDPFAEQGGAGEVPENPGRYAPLLGMLAVEAAGERQAIDFLSPRKRPAPPDRRRMYILAGAAAALVVLLGGYQWWSTFSAVDGQIEELSAELERLDEQMKSAEKRQKVITAIESWSKSDVNWLDELRDLSLRFPSGRDAMVLRMNMSQGRDSGGSIGMTGIVRDPIVVSHIEQNLRDKFHQISSRHMQQREQENNNYSWHFESSLEVAHREPEDYQDQLPGGQQAENRQAETRQAASTPLESKPAATTAAASRSTP